MDNTDDNHENRRISISDSSDDDSSHERDQEIVKTLQQMRMRIQRDMQQHYGVALSRESNNNTTASDISVEIPEPGGSGISSWLVGDMLQHPTTVDSNVNPYMRISRSGQVAVVWSDNHGTRKRTTPKIDAARRYLRECWLGEHVEREGRGDETPPGLPGLPSRSPRHGSLQSVIINPRASTPSDGPSPAKVRRLAPNLGYPPRGLVYSPDNLDASTAGPSHDRAVDTEDPVEPTAGPSGLQNISKVIPYESDISDDIDGDNEASPENKTQAKCDSQPADPDLNLVLLGLLECPVCLEHMEPPMAQCRRGHLTCRPCRARMLRCPVCRASFTSVRNRAIEQVAEKLRYPCRHGCSASVSLRGRGRHEASCERRLYACPLPACAHAPLPHQDLINHFLDEHAEVLSFGTKGTFHYSRAALPLDWIVAAHQQVFHVQFCTHGRHNGLFGSVTFIGPKKYASKYIYEITLHGYECSRKLTYSRETHSDLDCKNNNYSQGDTFFMSYENAGSFLKPQRNGNLVFTICVQPNANFVDSDSA